MPTYSKKRDELVLGVSEADFRLVVYTTHDVRNAFACGLCARR